MADWQPIETAPKDGSRVLLWTTTVGDETLTDYLDAVDEGSEPVTCAQIGRWDFGNDHIDPIWCRPAEWELQLIGIPTHWMPLPDAPSTFSPGEQR